MIIDQIGGVVKEGKDYFDNIPHDALMELVRQQIPDEECVISYISIFIAGC